MTGPEFDAERGIVRLSRAQLRALMTMEPERRSELESIGVVVGGRPHPALGGALATLRRPEARFVVRSWRDRGRSVSAGYVGSSAVVVLPMADEADEVVDVRVSARRTSLARVLADVLDLPAAASSHMELPGEPLTWERVIAPARTGEPGWTDGLFTEPTTVAVHDLRWSPNGHDRPATVLALAVVGSALVEIRATEPDERYDLVGRHPIEIWTALCRLIGPSPRTIDR